MPHKETKTHYGDEDPECLEQTSPEQEAELFETAKHLGWKPSDMKDEAFADRYKQWLAKQE
jgi:hypothetical protein